MALIQTGLQHLSIKNTKKIAIIASGRRAPFPNVIMLYRRTNDLYINKGSCVRAQILFNSLTIPINFRNNNTFIAGNFFKDIKSSGQG